MNDEMIEQLNAWFDNQDDRYYRTIRHKKDGLYVIDPIDADDFCKFLQDNMPNVAEIPCHIGNDGIWFFRNELKDARIY